MSFMDSVKRYFKTPASEWKPTSSEYNSGRRLWNTIMIAFVVVVCVAILVRFLTS